MSSSINVNFTLLTQCTAIFLPGLVAGLMYGYDCSVIKGLGNLSDELYVRSFKSINNAIQNPYFMISFMGCLLVLPIASWQSYHNDSSQAFFLLLTASLVYIIGVFGVTIVCNVPLNNRMDDFQLSTATENDISAFRKGFENAWNTYHRIRTVAAIIAFLLTILSLTKQKF